MLNVRSRAGVIGVTAGATVLLALPVVSLGQVPSVDQVAGQVHDAAKGVVQAAPAPSLPAPATRPAPRAPAQSRSAPAGSAPAQSHSAPPQRSSAGSSSSHGGGSGASSAHAGAAEKAAADGGERQHRPEASGDKKKNAAPDLGDVGKETPATGIPATDVQIADGTADAPRDASPGTLPFTGLQLALMAMLGLAAIAGGALLRRGVRHPQA